MHSNVNQSSVIPLYLVYFGLLIDYTLVGFCILHASLALGDYGSLRETSRVRRLFILFLWPIYITYHFLRVFPKSAWRLVWYGEN